MDNLNFSKQEMEIFDSISPTNPFSKKSGMRLSFVPKYSRISFNSNARSFLNIMEGSRIRMYQSRDNDLIWLVATVISNFNSARVNKNSSGAYFCTSSVWCRKVAESFRFLDSTGKSLSLLLSDKPIKVEEDLVAYQIYDNPFVRTDLNEDELALYINYLNNKKYIL